MTESDCIDVNSDTFNGVNASRSGNCGNDHPAETLADPLTGEVQVRTQKLVVDQARVEQEAGFVAELGSGSSGSAGDGGIRKRRESDDLERKTESVDGGFDLGTRIENVDVRTDDGEKFPVDSGAVSMGNEKKTVAEKASIGLCGEVLIDKEEEEDACAVLEQETAYSRNFNPSGVNDSDDNLDCEDSGVKDSDDNLRCKDSCVPGHVSENGNADGSTKRDMEVNAKVENPENIMDVDSVKTGLETNMSKDKNVLDDVDAPGDVKPALRDSDLVWAKVRSHPWWPGQIFDASAASEKAKKYFKKGSFLVTYFGDHTFAWNDASRIKPFRQNFSQMEKQSSLAEFRNAIDCALEEVSRRIGFGLACPCVSEEVYNKIKAQKIINPGIREDSCGRDGGNSFSSANSFEPAKLVEYIRSIACSPSYHVIDKLKFVTRRAQLLAFHRWKGYPELPEFETLHGSLETSLGLSSPGHKRKNTFEVTISVDKAVSSKKRKSEDNEDSSQKRKRHSEDRTAKSRSEKTLSEFIAEKRSSKKSGNRSDNNSGGKLVSDKKRRIECSECQNSAVKIWKNNLQTEDPMSKDSAKNYRKNQLSAGDTYKAQTAQPVFRVGASILKAASQMNSSSPIILKPCDDSSQKKVLRNGNKDKSLQSEPQNEELAQTEISSPDEMLSCLQLAAKNPMEKFSSITSLTSFYTYLRDSISLDNPGSEELEEFLKQASSSNIREDSVKSGVAKKLESRDVKDSTEVQVLPENKKEAADIVKDAPSIAHKITCSDSQQQTCDEDSPGGCSDHSCKDDCSEVEDASTPNALILKFTDLSSVPSEEKLNKIFSRYGPLRESETEVLKKSKRAKVVFRRGEDAETAFSSAGKYSIFGPSLLSYRLSYVASNPNKARKPGIKTISSTNGSTF